LTALCRAELKYLLTAVYMGVFDRKACPIGLDLGADCIKMLQLESTRAGVSVSAAAYYEFPANLEPDNPKRRDLAVRAVKRMLKEQPFRGRRVISALSDSDMVIKTIRLPQAGVTDNEELIFSELEKKLPFDLDSAQVQYLTAGRVFQGEQSFEEVIVLAARNEDIEEEIDLLSEMSLEPVALDAGPCALFRGFERFLLRTDDHKQVTLIVDIGAASTKVVIGHGPEIAFLKVIDIGSRDITQAVADHLGLSFAEAANLRRRVAQQSQAGSDSTASHQSLTAENEFVASGPVLAELAREVLTELAREISLCTRYHAVTFRGHRANCIKLAGGEAHIKQTVEFLSSGLGMPVEPCDPLKFLNVSRAHLIGNRREPAPMWAVSAGLAFRGLIDPVGLSGRAA